MGLLTTWVRAGFFNLPGFGQGSANYLDSGRVLLSSWVRTRYCWVRRTFSGNNFNLNSWFSSHHLFCGFFIDHESRHFFRPNFSISTSHKPSLSLHIFGPIGSAVLTFIGYIQTYKQNNSKSS